MSDTEQTIEDHAERSAGASQDAPVAAQGAADQEHGGPEPERDALQGDVEELVQALAKRDEYLALAQRTQADFENYRKRVAKEALAAQRKGAAKLARELLPALDNLDRALEAAAEEDPLLDGVKLVRGELHAALARAGIESFSPKGERFDPTEHEAMAQQPVDGVDGGLVAEVYQPGYRMGDEVIRPARVLVAA
jgi:molecular chaperone GrpE